MNDGLYGTAAIVSWLAVVYRLFGHRQQRFTGPQPWWLTIGFALGAGCITVSIPPVWTWVDRTSGVPNLTIPISHALGISYTACMMSMLATWTSTPAGAAARIASRWIATLAGIAVMVALFMLAPSQPENATTFMALDAHRPYYAEYTLVMLAVFASTQIHIAALCVRLARAGGDAWLRRGLRIMGTYGMCGVLYTLLRLADVFAPETDYPAVRYEPVTRLVLFLGMMCAPIGLTMPGWGPQLNRTESSLRALYAYARLAPLARAVERHADHLVLNQSAHPSGAGLLRDPRWHATGRVIEYLDLRSALSERIAAAPVTQFRRRARRLGLRGEREAGAVDAAALHWSLARPVDRPRFVMPEPAAPLGNGQLAARAEDATAHAVRTASAYHNRLMMRYLTAGTKRTANVDAL